ncbi:hypothetical protein B7L51_001140 [Pectobacterium brasiliense]|uniref:hypothetical protein n=1 Tax=Pectobacterium brasiliense TaxID=180957 RepID=UPI000B966431|nr:hypothetical protein [Pectobacterium carotovorum]OYN53233.1 hypothetical protein B7L51_01160 [Pectobacterium carotovorum]
MSNKPVVERFKFRAGSDVGTAWVESVVDDEGGYVSYDDYAALEQKLAASAVRLPSLNTALIEILGRPNFHCSPIAQCLRIGGAEIPRKSENEQAACIHWMLGLYLEHRENWKDAVKSELHQIAIVSGKEE